MRCSVDLLLYSPASGLLDGQPNTLKRATTTLYNPKTDRASNAGRCAAGKALLLSLA